jgi:hypothetical protein
MTYAEWFKLAPSGNASEDAIIEIAAKWVQWAASGVMAGASSHDAEIRYNLDQFWKYKAANYYSLGQAGRQKLETLDTWAHGYWAALETGKQVSAPASLYQMVKGAVTGEAPVRSGAEIATANLKTAGAGMSASGTAAGTAQGVALAKLGTQWASTADAGKTQADDVWKKMMSLGPLGVPWLVWGIAGVVGVGLIMMETRR